MKKITAFFVSMVMLLSLVTLASCGNQTTACKHEHKEEIVTNATCTVDGSTILRCKDCGTVIEKTTTPKLGHEYVAGFCTHDGCKDPIDHNNNRFYANLLCSIVDTTKYVFENDGSITLTNSENNYEYNTVKLLSGRNPGETAGGKETAGDEMLSLTARGSNNVDLRIVYDSENLRIQGLRDDAETLFVRANAEAVKKVLDFYKDDIKDIINGLPGAGGSGSGSTGGSGIGGGIGGSTGGMDVKTYLETIYDAIKTADGSDATVKSINTGIHNIIASVSAITETESGYEIALDKAKIKKFNHSVDVQTFENFVNNMFGDKTFTNVSTIIKLAVNSDPDLTDEEKTAKYNDILNDCKKLSLYALLEKNYKENNPDKEPLDIEKTIDEFVDNTDGLSVKFFTDKNGNIISGEIVADNFELFSDITIPITIGGVTSILTIKGYRLSGKFNVSFLKEKIEGDEYAPFQNLKGITDTTLAAGTYKGSPTAGNCIDFSFKTDSDGNIVSATSLFKLNENPDTNEAEYYKVVCSDPIAVVRKVDDNGKITYALNNFITADDFPAVNLNTKVYKADKDGNILEEITDQGAIDKIVSDIDNIEFSIVTPVM